MMNRCQFDHCGNTISTPDSHYLIRITRLKDDHTGPYPVDSHVWNAVICPYCMALLTKDINDRLVGLGVNPRGVTCR